MFGRKSYMWYKIQTLVRSIWSSKGKQLSNENLRTFNGTISVQQWMDEKIYQ